MCPGFRLYTEGRPCTRCLGVDASQVLRHNCLEGSRWRSVAAVAEACAARRLHWYDDVALLLTPSRFLPDRVIQGGLRTGHVRVVPNPVVLPEGADEPSERPVVACTGRLVEEKGVHVLLDAAVRQARTGRRAARREGVAGDRRRPRRAHRILGN